MIQSHTQKITIHKKDGTTEIQNLLWICATEGFFKRVGDDKNKNQGFLIQLGSEDSADNYEEVVSSDKHEMPEIEDIEITEADDTEENTNSDSNELSDEIVYQELTDVLNEE